MNGKFVRLAWIALTAAFVASLSGCGYVAAGAAGAAAEKAYQQHKNDDGDHDSD